MKWLYPSKEKNMTMAFTENIAKKTYQFLPSLLAYLPWVEFDDTSKTIMLQDKTVGAVFDLSLAVADGKPQVYLQQLRDGFQGIFQDVFAQYSDAESPWVIQFYTQDELSMEHLFHAVEGYVQTTAKNDPFKDPYLALIKNHCAWLSRPEGVFYDDKVTDSFFHGSIRKVRAAIYRQHHKKMVLPRGKTALQDLNQTAVAFLAKLKGVGVEVKRLDSKAFFDWLLQWFNPAPAVADGKTDALTKLVPYPKNEERPFGHDFAEQLFYCVPESNEKEGVWYFDGLPHRYVAIQHLSKVPSIGQLTLEQNFGRYRYSLFDKFPVGACFVMTVVIQSQETVKNHLGRIENGAIKSLSTAANIAFEDCQIAKNAIEKGNFLFPAIMGVYLRGGTFMDLADKETQLRALLINHGFHTLKDGHELVPLHAYVNQLPFCYGYNFDKKNLKRSGYVFAKQLANLLPLFGRERGTGRPLMQFFNRGGETICIDPFNPADKDNNSHLLVLGSTGSGKSAMCTDLLIKLMGTYSPYLIIVDAGNSFHLLKDYFEEQGLSVHHIAVGLNDPPILNPFVESEAMLKQIGAMGNASEQTFAKFEERLEEDFQELKNENDKITNENLVNSKENFRDYLGEMLLAALLMVTGGEKKEQDAITRQDKTLLIDAIVRGAQASHERESGQMIAEDIVNALRNMANELTQQKQQFEKQTRLRAMADSMDFFTKDAVASQVFNRRGAAWPDADVILFEQGLFKDEGYEAHNALAFMGLMSLTMGKAEQRQFQDRFTVVFGDEIHTITKNLLTVVYLTKCAKMSRKFGLWLWLATQNVSDFPAGAKKILSMMEFWVCLGTSEAEMKAIEEFRKLSEEEHGLFRSIRKSSRKYVEGVFLSPRMKTLFRNIPPRLSLALAMTEKQEKAERRKLMEQFNISELEAARMVARQMETKKEEP